MEYAILGLLVFIAVLVIFILAYVAKPKLAKEIVVYRIDLELGSTIKKFQQLGYEIKWIKELNPPHTVFEVCFVKVR